MIKFCIPYQGSKRGIADKLLNKMLEIKPNAKYFIDIFGGGGSMTFMAIQKGLKAWYNDYDTKIYNAMLYTINMIKSKKFDNELLKYINREQFKKIKEKQNKPIDYLYLYLYSFSNNGCDYLYNKDIERIKKHIHNYIIYNDEGALEEIEWHTNENDINFNCELKQKELNNRIKEWKKNTKKIKNKENRQLYDRLSNIERIMNIKNTVENKKLKIDNIIKITNLDYGDIFLDDFNDNETIIYCDPPYRDTKANYNFNFNFNDFDKWLNKNKYMIYISEYNAQFEKIMTIKKTVLSARINGLTANENLYINKDYKKYKRVYDIFDYLNEKI